MSIKQIIWIHVQNINKWTENFEVDHSQVLKRHCLINKHQIKMLGVLWGCVEHITSVTMTTHHLSLLWSIHRNNDHSCGQNLSNNDHSRRVLYASNIDWPYNHSTPRYAQVPDMYIMYIILLIFVRVQVLADNRYVMNYRYHYKPLPLRTIGAVVHGGSTIFCSGSPTGVRDVQRHLVFPVDFYILNGQIGHKKGISAKHWYVASFEIVQIH